VDPITTRFVHRFPDDAIEQIREKKLDVLIRFGFNILRGEILTAARYGVWSYHHGDNDYYRGGPAYFWEVLEGNPVSGATLQVLTEELDAGTVLYKGLFATHAGFSQVRNRVQPYWGLRRS
jgi:methionyl-tRNA formyltransferase